MKLGSLFDGSGGFPLAGALCGIEPVWASEIEAYPIAVTTQRFPRMKHLGDITKIDGGKIEPVDVITFGSPCQDLSVAGKRAGIHEGARSSLFFHAVRIMKEMREATNGLYPRIVIWENVHGAFSSNGGEDFRAVLKALCEIADGGVDVPRPPKGKWGGAGAIVGDGYSVAWRTYDAQYWGVPQRRRRIYLVADLGSERAGEILFEKEGVRGDSTQGIPQRQETAVHAAGGAGRGDGAGGIGAFHLQQEPICGSISPCIGGQHQATVGVFMGGQGEKDGGIGYSEKAAPTLRAVNSGSNQVPDIVYPDVARTLTAEHDSSPCVDRGQNVVALDCRNMVGNAELSGTIQSKNEGGFSLNFINPVVYSSGGFGTLSEGVGCLGTGTRATAEMVAVYDTTQITSPANYSNPKPGDACHPLAAQQHPPLAVYPEKTGSLCANSHPGSYTGQDAFNDMLPVVPAKPPRRYIIRRLTPLECCRLQGFPDWWTEGCERYPITMEQATNKTLFLHVNPMGAIKGADSPKYKMWGNGIALPCALHVMQGVARVMEEDT